jgi:glycosyltransferase involved in cell wall biosynthesis
MATAVLIPAYNPDLRLVSLVRQLRETGQFREIIVVNDGSRADKEPIFQQLAGLPEVTVLRHAINLGKGAALKSGFNYFCWALPDCQGVVTADADGQHLAEDIVRVAQRLEGSPDGLILGARQFREEVPLRSRLGNIATKYMFRLVVGTRLSDTQSGLRGVPRSLARELIRLRTGRYEFELDMLLQCKHNNIRIIEQPIDTVYLNHNRSSHFNPILDSLKIYYVLLRFMTASLLTAAVDYVVFLLAYGATRNILFGQVSARSVATGVNFLLNSHLVFRSRQQACKTLPRFLFLVIVMGATSYALIRALAGGLGWSVLTAKIASELILYVANFLVQRDFVFTSSRPTSPKTSAEPQPTSLRKAA